jgi:hypothetical protein
VADAARRRPKVRPLRKTRNQLNALVAVSTFRYGEKMRHSHTDFAWRDLISLFRGDVSLFPETLQA